LLYVNLKIPVIYGHHIQKARSLTMIKALGDLPQLVAYTFHQSRLLGQTARHDCAIQIQQQRGIVLLEYEKENNFISYNQQYLRDISININTEGVKLEELEFRGLPARYYSNQGVQNLFWYDDKYMYMVSSTLDRDIVIKIAESIEITGTEIKP